MRGQGSVVGMQPADVARQAEAFLDWYGRVDLTLAVAWRRWTRSKNFAPALAAEIKSCLARSVHP
jgi:hypothetical protein